MLVDEEQILYIEGVLQQIDLLERGRTLRRLRGTGRLRDTINLF